MDSTKNPTPIPSIIKTIGSMATVKFFTKWSDSDSKYSDSLKNISSTLPVSSPTLTICPTILGNVGLVDKSEEYGHMTANQAAQLANKANVKQLFLIHFSARYKNTQELEEDARNVFDNVICADDFMKIEL